MTDFINETVDGIVEALSSNFSYPVYDEPVEQGLNPPCFTVRCVHPIQKLFRGERYLVEHLMEVVFFPPAENIKRVSNAVLENLFNVLEIIEVGENRVPIRGTEPDVYIDETDHTIVFTIMFRYFARKMSEKVMMETLEQVHLPGMLNRLYDDEYEFIFADENGVILDDEIIP